VNVQSYSSDEIISLGHFANKYQLFTYQFTFYDAVEPVIQCGPSLLANRRNPKRNKKKIKSLNTFIFTLFYLEQSLYIDISKKKKKKCFHFLFSFIESIRFTLTYPYTFIIYII
jgi:hypothetical protein